MVMTRAHINLDTTTSIKKFVEMLNSDGTVYKYVLETADGKYAVNARSILGVIYLASEHASELYLVNETKDGVYPSGVNTFRVE